MRGQRDLRLARQTQSGRPTPFDHQFHRRRGLRHFYLHETRRRLAPVPALPPATKGGVMDTLPAGKIGSGQPAAIKRPQKLSAPGGIGPRRAASLRNTTLLHDRGFITARWQLIGGTLLYRLRSTFGWSHLFARGTRFVWNRDAGHVCLHEPPLHMFAPLPEFDLENAHYISLSTAKGVGRWP